MRLAILIPILTFVFGILAFSICALKTDAFWFNSSVDIPILKLPTLYIGDSIFIPAFNYYLFAVYEKTKNDIDYKKYHISFLVFTILATIVSFTINYVQHIEWTKDQYTGFIDLKPNTLSTAGWWHFIFASIEMTVISISLWLFSIFVIEKTLKGFALIKKLFWIFFLYSFLSILDFIIKEQYVIKVRNLLNAFHNNFGEIKVFLIGIILLITYYLIKKRTFNHN